MFNSTTLLIVVFGVLAGVYFLHRIGEVADFRIKLIITIFDQCEVEVDIDHIKGLALIHWRLAEFHKLSAYKMILHFWVPCDDFIIDKEFQRSAEELGPTRVEEITKQVVDEHMAAGEFKVKSVDQETSDG